MSTAEVQETPAATPVAAAAPSKSDDFANVILTKYKTAGEITAKATAAVIELCKAGTTVLELCKAGDEAIEKGTQGVWKDKKVAKGSAFPTTISINNFICNHAPLAVDPASSVALKDGDVVKIQLGAHLDGYAAVSGETVVVGATKESPVEGKTADLLKAVHIAADVAIRAIKPGATNFEVASQVEKAIKEFGVRPVDGMQSNLMDKDIIDGKKKIVLAPEPSNRPEACKLVEDEVYGIDLHITTSTDGKGPKTDNAKTTIYKKTTNTYLLKSPASRKVFSEIQKKAGAFPFTIGMLEDQTRARLGVNQCANHGLVTPFEPLYDGAAGALTAQIFLTVAVNAKGAIRLTPAPVWYGAGEKVKSEIEVKDEALKTLLAQPVRVAKKKNKAKKDGAEAAPAAAA